MYKILNILIFLVLIGFDLQAQDFSFERYPVIPEPVSLTAKKGNFEINDKTKIFLEKNGIPELKTATNFLINLIDKSSNYKLEYATGNKRKNSIIFSKDTSIRNDEGYELSIHPDQIRIRYKNAKGAFWAIQTLRQLMPPNIEAASRGIKVIKIPAVEITDAPRFAYRGFMLDVSRHFFNIDFLKKCIDVMAFYKLNTFHLHLTDDQGWRFEVKKYPLLQEISAWRNGTQMGFRTDTPKIYDGIRDGGYYTQEQLKYLVQYAKDRCITIIPEIDIPGHSQALLAAYPNLDCTDSIYHVAKGWGVHHAVLCPKEETFNFLKDVFTELIDVFPSKYIHIGGDEVPEGSWKNSSYCQSLMKKLGLKNERGLEGYFISKIEKFLNSKGRAIIGWDDILGGGIAPNATVMSWHGEKGGITAAKQGHYAIMTPAFYTYVNLYQTKDRKYEPLSNGGFLPLKKIYSYNPIPSSLTKDEAKYILGTEACLWTEYVRRDCVAETMTFPRACALAEVAWTPLEQKDYLSFTKRLDENLKHLKEMGVDYFRFY